MSTSIAFFIFDDAEELDWAGPWEVLSAWSHGWPEDAVRTFTVARNDGPVRCAKGLRVLPDFTWDSVPPFDVLIYPGGIGTRRQIGDAEIRTWVRQQAAAERLVASVCTGSLVLADSGLLDDLPATTHWASLDLLRSLGSGIDVRPDERFVDNGRIVTAAGVSAGIDMALHLVTRLHSVARAQEVRRSIQYDPEPPV
ncbi:MAG: DJ-1/PfpI family protein [Acidimicrobiia bacterium]